MNREEFLEILKTSLAGEVSQAVLLENLNYYDEYIMTQIRKGKSEEEVMEELGSPRLIAKTIIDTHSGSGYEPQGYACGEYDGTSGDTYGDTGGEEKNGGDRDGCRGFGGRTFHITGFKATLLLIVAAALLIFVVGALLSFLMPVLLVLAGVAIVTSVIRNIMSRRG